MNCLLTGDWLISLPPVLCKLRFDQSCVNYVPTGVGWITVWHDLRNLRFQQSWVNYVLAGVGSVMFRLECGKLRRFPKATNGNPLNCSGLSLGFLWKASSSWQGWPMSDELAQSLMVTKSRRDPKLTIFKWAGASQSDYEVPISAGVVNHVPIAYV